jgi:hypothetical protein
MSTRRPVGRRDLRDGRALRVVDDRFWAREKEMLKTRLLLLQEFMKRKGMFYFSN